MSTAVATHASTHVRTAVRLTDAIMGTFEHILAHPNLRRLSTFSITPRCGPRAPIRRPRRA